MLATALDVVPAAVPRLCRLPRIKDIGLCGLLVACFAWPFKKICISLIAGAACDDPCHLYGAAVMRENDPLRAGQCVGSMTCTTVSKYLSGAVVFEYHTCHCHVLILAAPHLAGSQVLLAAYLEITILFLLLLALFIIGCIILIREGVIPIDILISNTRCSDTLLHFELKLSKHRVGRGRFGNV